MQLEENDLKVIKSKGIEATQLQKQIETFKQGIPHVDLVRPATIGDGIIELSSLEKMIELYENNSSKVLKFTPASGAATRMFKLLHQLMSLSKDVDSFKKLLNSNKFSNIQKAIPNLSDLAFYSLVEEKIEQQFKLQLNQLDAYEKAYYAFQVMLDKNGLDLSNLPKGLIYFHNYDGDLKTPFEEHFFEAAAYASKDKKASLHFTVSPKHQGKFEQKFKQVSSDLEKQTGVSFEVSYSYQKESTDTIAVDENNQPVKVNNQLYFRPGGHGALIQNLNQIDASIIFIKNIDNITHRDGLASNAKFKKALAGVLLEKQKEIFNLITKLRQSPSQSIIEEAKSFIQSEFNDMNTYADANAIIDRLNRPIRVCGMVENTGAPGGGPFWVVNGKGEMSLQIVEKAQMNTEDQNQLKVIEKSTHFNPVDLVCGVEDVDGNKFDLLKFVNHKRGFITHKSVQGKPIKALELPGLWNGAMEYWNTFFVEVPLSTFCPVKSVFDLLKPMHLADD